MIKQISLKNFRGHKTTTLNFGPGVNYLVGPNESGKTTVGHAIVFTYFGTDLHGSSRGIDHLIYFGEDRTEVVLSTDKVVLHRTKKREATSAIKLGLVGAPLAEADQSSLTKRLGIGQDAFSSCIDAGYFMKLDTKRRIEVIGQLAKTDRVALLKSLVGNVEIPKGVKLVSPRVDAQNVATQRRGLQNELASDQGSLAMAQAQIQEIGVFDAQARDATQASIKAKEGELELFRIYNLEMQTYKVALARAKDAEESNQRNVTEKQKLTAELAALGEAPATASLASLEESLRATKDSLEALRRAKKQSPLSPTLPNSVDEASCTRCGQVVTEKMRSSIQAERDALITNYNIAAREVATHNQKVDEDCVELGNKVRSLEVELSSLKEKASYHQARKKGIEQRLSELSSTVKQITVPQQPVKPDGDQQKIDEELRNLTASLMLYKQAETRFASLNATKENLSISVAAKQLEIDKLGLIEEALLQLPELETRATLDKLSIKDMKVELEDSGDIVITDSRGVPYQSLSSGRQMKTDIQLAVKLQALLGTKAPNYYFVDNADLVDDLNSYLPSGAQVFIAKVDAKATELSVVSV